MVQVNMGCNIGDYDNMIYYGEFDSCFFLHIEDPLKRVNLRKKARMGVIEEKIMEVIEDIYACEAEHGNCCTDFDPWLCVQYIQEFRRVSPYVITDSKLLHDKMVI